MMELLLKIVVLCMYNIDPSFDKDRCAELMLTCTQGSTENFVDCADLWEPANDGVNYEKHSNHR
jgi:hypothetical protein